MWETYSSVPASFSFSKTQNSPLYVLGSDESKSGMSELGEAEQWAGCVPIAKSSCLAFMRPWVWPLLHVNKGGSMPETEAGGSGIRDHAQWHGELEGTL